MNLAAGCIARRQSATLIAALRTRVADQSSDACQYFRIIAEGVRLSSLTLAFSLSLLPLCAPPPFIPSILCLLFLRATPSFVLYVVAPAASSLHAKRNECRGESQATWRRISLPFSRYFFPFLKRPGDALMRSGLYGWTEAPDFARDRRG